MTRALALVAAIAAVAGCAKDRTEAVVVVTTDGVRVPDDVDAIRLRVADTADLTSPLFEKKFRVCGGAVGDNCLTLPLDFTLIPGAHLDHSSRVQLTATRNDIPVIDDAAIFTFTPGQSLRLDFVLYANCVGNVDCAARDQACGPDATCHPVTPVHIGGDPDLGTGAPDLAGGDDLAGIDDLASAPADLAMPDLAGCIPSCAVGYCGMSNCNTPCSCVGAQICVANHCQNPGSDGGTGSQVLNWTSRSFDGGEFYGVWGVPGAVFAVGNFAGSSAVFLDTSSDPLMFAGDPRYTPMGTLYAVSGRSASDVYATGPNGIVVHFDGNSWTDAGAGLSLNANGVWVGGPADDVWVAAGNLSSPGSDPWAIAHHSSALFPPPPHWSATTGTGHAYQAAWGDGNGFVLLLADETVSSFSTSNGPTTNFPLGGSNPLYGAFGLSAANMWAVGGNGTIWRLGYNGSLIASNKETLSPTTTTTLYSVHGTPGSLWAVGGSGAVYHSTGDGTWTLQTNLGVPTQYCFFRGVYALAPNDVYVVGTIMGTKIILHGQ